MYYMEARSACVWCCYFKMWIFELTVWLFGLEVLIPDTLVPLPKCWNWRYMSSCLILFGFIVVIVLASFYGMVLCCCFFFETRLYSYIDYIVI